MATTDSISPQPIGVAQVSESDDELLLAAVGGDPLALERLLLRHFSMVQLHITLRAPKWLQRQVAIDDLLQETFSQAFRDVRRFNARSDHSLGAWLKKIADHRLHDAIRHYRRRKRGGGLQAEGLADSRYSSLFGLAERLATKQSDSPSHRLARDEAVAAMYIALAGLPDSQREAICRHYLNHERVRTVAAAMGRSPAAVRSLVYRAKVVLRNALGRSSRWFFHKE